MSQKVLQYIEIDIDYCSLTYSVAPCQASLVNSPPTGTIKCFNSIATCQDRANFNNIPVTLRFAVSTDYLPAEIECIPSINDITFDPAVISLGENLGQRATLTVTFDDHRHSDTGAGFDKYLADRPYDPYSQGTFWGKFRARQPFLQARPLRWITGFVGDALADMETRHYLIESTTGPDATGKFTIIAKDILKLADGDRALAPLVSNGFLTADITETDQFVTLSPTGIGAEYPATGYVNLGGSEIVSYGIDKTAGNDSFCKLLLHCEGTEGSTTFTDASPAAHGNASVGGAAKVTLLQHQFGTGAMSTGSGFVGYTDNADWFFNGDFTVDLWARHNTLSASACLAGNGTDANNYWRLFVTSAGALTFQVNVSGSFSINIASANGLITTATWYHAAIVRFGNVWTIYLNGNAVATTTNALVLANYTGNFLFGLMHDGATFPVFGWLDEMRVSKGIARWTANFTPSPAPYGASGDVLYLNGRAQFNTPASQHQAQDRAQLVLTYSGAGPDDIIADLLENYAAVDPSLIPLADWHTEISTYLNRLYSAVIPQPTSVNTLISELIEQAGLSMWWDDRNEIIGLMVLRGLVFTTVPFSEQNFLADSFEVTEQPDTRLSQVYTYFGQINPLTSLNEKNNYRSVSVITDAGAEIDYGSPAIKEIFSRWIPALGRSIADRLGTILLGRFTDPPRHLKVSVLRKSLPEIMLARGYQITETFLQDVTGASAVVNMQVTRLKPAADIIEVEADEVLYLAAPEDLTVRNIIVDANAHTINLRAVHDLIYPAPAAGVTVILTVNSGIILGSTNAALVSLDVGSWPAGVIVIVHIIGRLQGAGGTGSGINNNTSQPGGTALYTRVPVKLSLPGQLWGGGGGGAYHIQYDGSGNPYVTGGGGGAGFDPGLGGTGLSEPNGNPGTTEAGGAFLGFAGFGGGPGLAGSNSSVVGGAAGKSIDGVSFVTTGTWDGTTFTPGALAGDVRGPQIN